jgi:hypothetical protein
MQIADYQLFVMNYHKALILKKTYLSTQKN